MKIAVLGYGKMGKTIEQLAQSRGDEIVFTSTSTNKRGTLENADVAIDFSTPEIAFSNIKECLNLGIPTVSGTTGWLDRYQEILNICESSNGTFLYASNFSVGVNLFFALNKKLADLMKRWPDYEVSMKEIHHTQKKDAPSGTAISLADAIIENSNKEEWVLGDSTSESVGIKAIREGEIKGTHSVLYESDIDLIQIKHKAKRRDGFALGALIAAKWIQGKKGVYSMADVLNITED